MASFRMIRLIFPFTYHLRRIIGVPDKGEIALLGAEDHPLLQSWCVQIVTDGKTQPTSFDLPKLESHVDVKILPHQNPAHGSWKQFHQDSDDTGRSPANSTKWFLLAKGHSRVVEPFIKQGNSPSADSPGQPVSILRLRLGDERLAEPSGKNVFTTEAANALGSASGDMPAAVYSELGNQIRLLTDVRFRLLTFVPTVSGLALTILLTQPVRDASPLLVFLASVFGFGITLGIRIYDVRNSQLYDDLISRARSLEALFGVERGPYMRRSRSLWPIEHDFGLLVVYALVLSAWLVSAVVSLSIAVSQVVVS
ncbi:hypothetical protein [Pseudarthrobacter sulfonivorans]|uniref:hypothetical protein n=1 Tax=Pseudarthrobacter sulfonivorans TaxID=121292 RepID=UPI002789B7C8|nr:hypothetical protein [Pseudarthrobacter sulfonivorans]MDQ0000111.1 hypothetical protein [Pseudarthrobacter sulfonivorans]